MFIRLVNGTPETYTISQLRRDNPNTSFPRDLSPEILANYGVYEVKDTNSPNIDYNTHTKTPEIAFLEGEWREVWNVTQLPLEQASVNLRTYRDSLLQETDWVVAKSYERGEAVPQQWVTYRQALREVTAQQGFPYSVIWPTKPE